MKPWTLLVALPIVCNACVLPGVTKHKEAGTWITLKDGVNRREAISAVDVFLEHRSSPDLSGMSISVGKWHTPGAPTELDLKCQFAVTYRVRGSALRQEFCIGYDEESGKLAVLIEAISIS